MFNLSFSNVIIIIIIIIIIIHVLDNYVEKLTLFGHSPWEYLGEPITFSADPRTSINLWSHKQEFVFMSVLG